MNATNALKKSICTQGVSCEPESKKRKLEILNLPSEMCIEIIKRSFTPSIAVSLAKYSLVCKNWLMDCTRVKIELLNVNYNIEDVFYSLSKNSKPKHLSGHMDVLSFLHSQWKYLSVLNLGRLCVCDNTLEFLTQANGLNQLTMHNGHNQLEMFNRYNLTAAGMLNLAKFEKLTDLRIDRCHLSDFQFLKVLTNLKSLRLEVNMNHIPQDVIVPLGVLTQLQKLDYNGPQIADHNFLANFTILKELRWNGHFGKFNADSLKSISKLTALKCLDLDGSPTNENSLIYISNLANLELLCLRHAEFSSLEDAPHKFKVIGSLNKLTSLILDNNDFSDESFEFVSNLTNLTYLDVMDVNLEKFNHLSVLTNLQVLSMGCDSIDLDLEKTQFLGHLTCLTDLSIFTSTITKEAIGQIKNLKNITSLSIEKFTSDTEDSSDIEGSVDAEGLVDAIVGPN